MLLFKAAIQLLLFPMSDESRLCNALTTDELSRLWVIADPGLLSLVVVSPKTDDTFLNRLDAAPENTDDIFDVAVDVR